MTELFSVFSIDFSECFCIIIPCVEDGSVNRPLQLCVMSMVILVGPSAGRGGSYPAHEGQGGGD